MINKNATLPSPIGEGSGVRLKKQTTMKNKLLIILISLFMVSYTAKAADKDYKLCEVQLGYGLVSYDGMMIRLAHLVDNLEQSFTQYYEIPMSSFKRYGDVSFSFKFRPANRIMIGATLIWTGTKSDVCNRTYIEGEKAIQMGTLNYNFFTPAIDLNVLYIAKEKFKLYGDLGLGYTIGLIDYKNVEYKFSHNPDKKARKMYNHFNFQFSPIGFKFGNRAGGFVEFGFGYRGIISGGFFANF
jgi:hypothetical protein